MSSGDTNLGGANMKLYIQVAPLPAAGSSPQTVRSALKEISKDQLQAVGAVADEVQRWLHAKFAQMEPKPSSISLEFGIDAEGEAGIPFVTKGTIGANFKVALEWKGTDK